MAKAQFLEVSALRQGRSQGHGLFHEGNLSGSHQKQYENANVQLLMSGELLQCIYISLHSYLCKFGQICELQKRFGRIFSILVYNSANIFASFCIT
jgi:hypothetical protein